MKKIFFAALLANVFSLSLKAQKGNNELSLNIEPAIANKSFGLGVFGKYAYGFSKASQITFSAGISRFGSFSDRNGVTQVIPFLIGYKHHFNSFFIEPQIGIGSLSGRIDIGGDVSKPSVAAAFGSIGVGYSFSPRFNIGIRFLAAHGIEKSSKAGLWYDKDFNYTSLVIGYNIFRKNK